MAVGGRTTGALPVRPLTSTPTTDLETTATDRTTDTFSAAPSLPPTLRPSMATTSLSSGSPVAAPSTAASAAATAAPSSSSLPPPPALASLTSPAGYVFPPVFSFPPFFTPQPNAATHAHQTALWTALILSWARWHRVFELRADEGEAMAAVFEHKQLRRRAGREYQRELMQALVDRGASCPAAGSRDPRGKRSLTLAMGARSVCCARRPGLSAAAVAAQELEGPAVGRAPVLAHA